MVRLELVPHPDFADSPIASIEVAATRASHGRLDFEFCAAGDVDRASWPDWIGVEPADGLWQHSCFEAFVGFPDQPGYVELNFSTSGQWAAYQFDGYRAGMRPLGQVLVAGGRTWGEQSLRVRRSVQLTALDAEIDWCLGLSAVIEAADGTKSYWALAHPPGRPDFHASVCFAARLAAPAGA
ncbi:MAG: DOMON-like domain-containing protein [Sphingomonas sp.]